MFGNCMKSLLKANDIYDILKPLFFVSKILGLVPIKFNKNGTAFKDYAILNIIEILIITCITVYLLIWLEIVDFSENIAGLALRVELYLGMIITIIILVLAKANQKLLMRILNGLNKIDCKLNYKTGLLLVYFQVIGITCIFITKLVIQLYVNSNIKLYIYSIFNVVDYANTIMLFQYVDILLILRQKYVSLNAIVKERGVIKNNITFLKRYVRKIANSHDKLYQVCLNINKMYGIQLLVTIAARFIMITIQLINVYKLIQDGSLLQTDSISYALPFIYLFLHGSKIFMIVAVSENVVRQSKKTGVYLHRYWNGVADVQVEVQILIRLKSILVL